MPDRQSHSLAVRVVPAVRKVLVVAVGATVALLTSPTAGVASSTSETPDGVVLASS